jgi:predicted aldo/keto reductase-like oxidoreductase
MKTPKEIFESTVKNTRFEQLSASSDIGQGIIMGYTQCQKDILDALEMHILINEHDWNRNPQAQLRDFIESLNKQD